MPLIGLTLINPPGEPLHGPFPKYAGGRGKSRRNTKPRSGSMAYAKRKRKTRRNPVRGVPRSFMASQPEFKKIVELRKLASNKVRAKKARSSKNTKEWKLAQILISRIERRYAAKGGKKVARRKPAVQAAVAKAKRAAGVGKGTKIGNKVFKSALDKNKKRYYTINGKRVSAVKYRTEMAKARHAHVFGVKKAPKKSKRKTAKRKSPKKKTTKRKTAKRKRPKAKRKKGKLTKAQRSAAAKKGARTRKRNAKKSTSKRAKAKKVKKGAARKKIKGRWHIKKRKPSGGFYWAKAPSKRKKTKRTKKMAKRRTKTTRYAKRKTTKKRKGAKGKRRVIGFPVGGKKRPGKKKGRRYGARSIATRKYAGKRVRLMAQKRKSKKTGKPLSPWFGIRRNPTAALKQAFVNAGMTFVGMIGTRALSKVLAGYMMYESKTTGTGAAAVTTKTPRKMFVEKDPLTGKLKPNTLASFAPSLPSFLILMGSVFGQKALKKSAPVIQQGAALAFFDTLLAGAVRAFDDKGKIAPYVTQAPIAMKGYSEYVEWGDYGMGEYLEEGAIHPDYDMGMGVDVEEALADDEVDAFQTGYASGTLARSVFSV